MTAPTKDNPIGAETVMGMWLLAIANVVEMVDHEDTIEYSHTEEGNEAHACRNAERQVSKPQCYYTSDERQRNG